VARHPNEGTTTDTRTGQLQFVFPIIGSIEEHPCYWPNLRTLGHRAYVVRGRVMYCERCGAEIDENKKNRLTPR